MHFSSLIPAITLLAPAVSAVGNARVVNRCPQTVYAWSVGGSVGPRQTLATGQTYSEVLRRDPQSGGISIKISKNADGLYNASPQTHYAYSLDGANIWYDLSSVFGDAFSGSALNVRPSVTSCPSISWPQGRNPGGSQVKVCNSNSNITLTLCG